MVINKHSLHLVFFLLACYTGLFASEMFAHEKRTVKQREEDIYYAIVANMFAYQAYEYMSFYPDGDSYCFNSRVNPYLRKDEKYKLYLTTVKPPVLGKKYFGEDYIYYEFYLEQIIYYDSCGFTGDCMKWGRSPLKMRSRFGAPRGLIAYDTTRDMIQFLAGYGYLEEHQGAFIDSTLTKVDIVTYIKIKYMHMNPDSISLDSVVYFPTISPYDSVFIYISFYCPFTQNRFSVKMHYEPPKTWFKDIVIEDPSKRKYR